MAEARKWRLWAGRLTLLAAVLSIGGALAALIAAYGSGHEYWHFRSGLKALRYCFFAAAAGGLLALVAIFLRRRGGGRLGLLNLIALLVSLAFCFYLYSLYRTAYSVPPIHDVSTNLVDYPRYYRLRVRDDNLASVPADRRPDLAALTPRERWMAYHRDAYRDLATLRVQWPVAETVGRAERLARDRGWEVVTVDTGQGILEAVATSRFFRFKDNIVVRVRPLSAGGGSMVDMRSMSRVGVSDVGANARRIRDFLADLRESR
ncbi:MAG: hypothetical protein QOI38_3035 [Sphingomonadales bacterium]|jgi:uncharacterized protein (DUF1499 family)|nr:hypothetical protein [Sphingomonadales bacterium]